CVSQEGDRPVNYLSRPAPDPQMFGLPTQDDGVRTDPLLNQNMITGAAYRPAFDALRAAHTKLVIAVGEESAHATAGRGGTATAERLDVEPVYFPGGHDGFLGGEYGRTG